MSNSTAFEQWIEPRVSGLTEKAARSKRYVLLRAWNAGVGAALIAHDNVFIRETEASRRMKTALQALQVRDEPLAEKGMP